MEETADSIVEERKELVVSPSGSNPKLRRNQKTEPPFPASFNPKSWPLKVKFNGWRYPPENWESWVEKMASLHKPTWEKAGIFEAILNSRYKIIRNDNVVLGLAEKWCDETKSFIFPWGEATIALEDVSVLGGFSLLGSPVFKPLEEDGLKKIEEKLEMARKELNRTPSRKACQYQWLSKFRNSGSEIEHEAFIALWLSRFVFPSSWDVIVKNVFPMAVRLASGDRIALAPAVLAHIYKELRVLKENIISASKLEKAEEFMEVTLWSPFNLVQVWGFERFTELTSKPRKVIEAGEPKLGQWHDVKCITRNVRTLLDSAKKSWKSENLDRWVTPISKCSQETVKKFKLEEQDNYVISESNKFEDSQSLTGKRSSSEAGDQGLSSVLFGENDSNLEPNLKSSAAKIKELNDSPFPPGFPSKCSSLNAKVKHEEDKITIAELLKSGNKDEMIKKRKLACSSKKDQSEVTGKVLLFDDDDEDLDGSIERKAIENFSTPSHADRSSSSVSWKRCLMNLDEPTLGNEALSDHDLNCLEPKVNFSRKFADLSRKEATKLSEMVIELDDDDFSEDNASCMNFSSPSPSLSASASQDKSAVGVKQPNVILVEEGGAADERPEMISAEATRVDIRGEEGCSSSGVELPKLEIECRIEKLERLVAKLKAALLAIKFTDGKKQKCSM